MFLSNSAKRLFVRIDNTQWDLEKVKRNVDLILKNIAEQEVYSAIGMPVPASKHGKRIGLLIGAKDRGFFKDDTCFHPLDGWLETALFKHSYSNIPDSYRYVEKDDSLYIPAIGIKDNFSAGCVCIYKNGHWAGVWDLSVINKQK